MFMRVPGKHGEWTVVSPDNQWIRVDAENGASAAI